MVFELIAEEKIREAIDNGVFDNLKGAGKRLQILDDTYSGDDWAGLHILRENGFLPEWLELRKQIYYSREGVTEAWEAWCDEHRRWGSLGHVIVQRAGALYAKRVKEINAQIDLHNVRCPSIAFEITRFREDRKPGRDQAES
jgi:hypothetical protein